MFFDGPHIGRHQDLNAFADCEIKYRYETILGNHGLNPAEHQILGDALFPNRPPSILSLTPSPPQDIFEVEALDRLTRGCAEWCNSKITENWKGITLPGRMKLELFPVAQEIVVAALLTNCLTILHGHQAQTFFASTDYPFLLQMPTLEEYFDA